MEDPTDAEDCVDLGGNWGVSKSFGGDSTCCAVELKYRARLGRRKVGGKADVEIRMSSKDFLTVLLNILRVKTILTVTNA